MSSPKHAETRWRTYRAAHERWMNQLYKGEFIQADNLRWKAEPGHLFLDGQIACKGNILITVQKILEVLDGDGGDALVRTVRYNYNASVRGYDTFLRHDNADHHGFATPHHKHERDWKNARELTGSPSHVGEEGWPTLGEFVNHVADWYADHYSELPEKSRDDIAQLDPNFAPR